MKKFLFASLVAIAISGTMGFANANSKIVVKAKANSCACCTHCTCDNCTCTDCTSGNCTCDHGCCDGGGCCTK